jgi:hypothetical protein
MAIMLSKRCFKGGDIAGEMLMTDHLRHRQAQYIADVVIHHTQEVNQLIGLFKQQAASLDQLTDIMSRLTRVLEHVSGEFAKESRPWPPAFHSNGKSPLPFFMGPQPGSTRDSSEV